MRAPVELGPVTVARAGRGWRARCEKCRAESPTPREKLSAALEWYPWHAQLRGCVVAATRVSKGTESPRVRSRRRMESAA